MPEHISRPFRLLLLSVLVLLPAACATPPGAPGLSMHFKTADDALTLVFVNDGDTPRTITGIHGGVDYCSTMQLDDGRTAAGIAPSRFGMARVGGFVVEAGKRLELDVSDFRRVKENETISIFVEFTCEGVKHHERLEIVGRLREPEPAKSP